MKLHASFCMRTLNSFMWLIFHFYIPHLSADPCMPMKRWYKVTVKLCCRKYYSWLVFALEKIKPDLLTCCSVFFQGYNVLLSTVVFNWLYCYFVSSPHQKLYTICPSSYTFLKHTHTSLKAPHKYIWGFGKRSEL